MIYFTSDTHFGSERTLKSSRRPFISVKSMDTIMIDNWNNIVDEEDIVYHLGDFGDYNIAKRLNGRIILILGNYELKDIKYKGITLKQLNEIFDEVHENGLITFEKENKYIMYHEPKDLYNIGFNKTILNKNCTGLFGNIHKLQMVKKFRNVPCLNVGVDCHDFTPINEDTIKHYTNDIINFYDENVFI